MDTREAYILLGLSPEDDLQKVRAKFRRLMGRYHPDAVGSDHPMHTARAQQLNEAYQVVKQCLTEKKSQTEKTIIWQGEENHLAFAERNIYMPYHMDLSDLDDDERSQAKGMFQTVARGKYYWDPDEEEFVYFFKSIHHLGLELLKEIEERTEGLDEQELMQLRLPVQLQLMPLLSGQFVRPIACLRKLLIPESVDERRRETYQIRAWLGTKGNSSLYKHIAGLCEGDLLYPQAVRNNRLYVTDVRDREMGALSFEEDALYVVLIPLMQSKKVQVKMNVRTVTVKKRPMSVRTDVTLSVRLRENAEDIQIDEREKIGQILERYTQEIRNI